MPRLSLRHLLAPAVALGLLIAAPARAQVDIGQDVKIAASLTAEQAQQVDQYVGEQMNGIISGNPDRVVDGRQKLLSQFRTPGASDAFLNAMSNAVMKSMKEAVEHEELLVRLNAMIVATRLTTPEAIDVLRDALKDDSAAVRFWGAKALRDLVERTELPRNRQMDILQTIEPLIVPEAQVPVVKVHFQTLAEMDIPEARKTLINMLNLRASFHVARPNQPHIATEEGLRQAYLKLATDTGNIRAERKELVRAAYRYLDLISKQLADGDVMADNVANHGEMVNVTYTVLNWGWTNAGGDPKKLPENPKTAVQFKRWQEVRRTVQSFERLLTAPGPYQFEPQELRAAG